MLVARAADGAEEGGWVPRSDGLKIGAGVWYGWRQGVEVGRRLDRLNYLVDSLPAICLSAIYEATGSNRVEPCCIINSQGSFGIDSINSKKQKKSGRSIFYSAMWEIDEQRAHGILEC